MNINSFKPMFNTWQDKFLPFLSSKDFSDIYSKLKELGRSGKQIFPKSTQTYRAFELCDYNNLKCVIVGMAPYHTKKNGIIVADGVALSCGNTLELQPSLEQWYKACEDDLYNGLNLHMEKEPDLSFLCQQGVLMYNISMTVEEGKAGNHIDLWEPFNKFFFEEIINKYNRGLCIVFLGKEAAKYEKLVNPMVHYTKIVEHPAASSYAGREWKHENLFSWINNILKQNNGEEYQIKWIKENEDSTCPF